MQAPVDPLAPDDAACPLCGQANQCAMQAERVTGVKQPPCWCTQIIFTKELLARIPTSARGVACVCAACAAAASA